MNWDTGNWDSGFWDALSDYFHPQTKHNNKRNTMKRQNYYPSRIADQLVWLMNYFTKLPIHGPTCGVAAGDITASVADAKWCNYVLGLWLAAVRAFSPSTTDAVDLSLTGTGSTVVVLPGFTAPALPAGVVAQLPGALTRIFALIAQMKLNAGYTEVIGSDLGIVGSEDNPGTHPFPKVIVEVMQGPTRKIVRSKFTKYTHEGVYIESRRGNGDWEFLAIDTLTPYDDDRPLLVEGTPEVREYRYRFWDKGTPNGEWTDVKQVTVSP